MDILCVCVICKKVFSDEQALKKHKKSVHSIRQQQNQHQKKKLIHFEEDEDSQDQDQEEENLDLYSTASSAEEEDQTEEEEVGEVAKMSAPFSRNKSLTITRVSNVKKGTAMNQNQKPMRKMPPGSGSGGGGAASQSINVRRAEMKMKMAEGRAKAPSSGGSVAVSVGGTNAKWQKWVHRNASGESQQPPQPQYQTQTQSQDGNGMIITPSAAERATSAFCSSAAELTPSPRGKVVVSRGQAGQGNSIARKSVPHLIPMPMTANQNGNGTTSTSQKRPPPGTVVTRPPPGGGGGRTATATSSSVVPDIMQNLGKIKSLNQQARTGTSSKVPKVAQPQPPSQPPSFRMGKPPQVPKNKGKIVPRNAYNNALPKPTGGSSLPPRLHAEEEMDVDDSDGGGDYFNPPDLPIQEGRRNANATSAATASKPNSQSTSRNGKAPPPKSLSSNRHNPINSKGRQVPPKAPPPVQNPTPTPPSPPKSSKSSQEPKGKLNGSSSSSSSSSVVVAKKSAPKSSHEDKMRKMKQYVPTMPGTNYDMPSLSAVGSYTNRNGQQVWICLVCNAKEQEESSQDMICCDTCEDWYHWGCVGIHSVNEDDPWYCKRCIFQASRNPSKDFPTLFKSNVPP